jgi:hypothetical protein
MYVVGGFSVLRAELAPGSSPDTNSLNAFDVRRSYFSGSSVSAASQWSSRASTVVSYRFDVRRFGQTLGDATTHSVGVGYRHRTTRRSVLRLDYGLGDARYEALERSVPATSHNGSAGFELDHPISATRRLAVSVGAGASIVRTTSLSSAALEEFVTPTGFTSVRYDWARSWSVSADYRRAISNLEGISAESFKTDAALARVGGFVHRNAEVTATAGFSNGSSGLTISGFRTWTVASQLRLRLRRRLWTVVTHSYYRYSLQSIGTALASAPPNFDRQSIRVGLSLDWPVYRSRNARPRQDFE